MKKILFIMNDFVSGGCETQMFYLINELKKDKNLKISILYLGHINSTFFSNKKDDIEGIELINFKDFRQAKNKLFFLIAYIKLFKLISNAKYDVLIPYHRNTSIILSIVNFFLKKKCFFQERGGAMNLFGTKNPIVKKIIKYSRPIYVANNNSSAKLLSQKYDIPQSNINVIYNGIQTITTTYDSNKIRQKNGIPDNEIVLTFVANYYPEKDHQSLLEAIVSLNKAQQNNNCVFLLVGNDNSGGNISNYRNFVKENHLENKVRFLENIFDVREILSITDIALFCSKSEGLANALIEYIQFELPIVTSRIPVFEEVLGTNYKYMYDVNSVDNLKDKIYELIVDTNRKQFGIELSKTHMHKFDLKSMTSKYNALIFGNEKVL